MTDDGDGSSHEPNRDKGHETQVTCDADDLIRRIALANNNGGGTLKLTQDCTYNLSVNDGESGLPTIVAPITVEGNHATIIRAASAAAFRIFIVGAGGVLTLNHLAVEGGTTTDMAGGGGILVRSAGTVHLVDTKVSHNSATGVGGGIANYGTTTTVDSTVSVNNADTGGGGIFSTGSLTVNCSKVVYNNTVATGGGILASGTVVVEESEIGRNHAETGGGMTLTGPSSTSINDSAIKDNTSGGAGGGVENGLDSQLTISNGEIARNTATLGDGGGINNAGSLVLNNSEVTGNTTRASGGGVANQGTAIVRGSRITKNNAIGGTSVGGGILNNGGNVTLNSSSVTDNTATVQPGGVVSTNTAVSVDSRSTIIRNRPTNCLGSTATVPNCFG